MSLKSPQSTYKNSQSWTDDLPVCKNTGIGFSTNQVYREDGNPQEDHPYEDCSCHFKFNDHFYWYAVFDGHEGKRAADFCSQRMTAEIYFSQLNEAHISAKTDEEVKELLRQAFITVEQAYMETLEDALAERASLLYDIPEGMNTYEAYQKVPHIVEGIKRLNAELSSGTAAAVALISNGKLYVANVGNCRVLLCQTDENSVLKVVQLSVDHDLKNEDELLRLSQLGINTKVLRHSSRLGNQENTRCIGNYTVKGGYKDFDDLNYAIQEPIIAEPDIHGGIVLEESCRFLLLMSAGLYKSIEEATGKDQVNKFIAQCVVEQINDEKKNPTDSCLKCWLNLKMAYKIQQGFLLANQKLTKRMDELNIASGTENDSLTEPLESMDQSTHSDETEDSAVEDEVEEQELEIELPLKEELVISIIKEEEESPEVNEAFDIKEEELSDIECVTICDDTNGGLIIKSEPPISSYTICKICGKSLADDVYLKHVTKHYQMRVQCDECDTYCENIKAYQEHIVTRHKDYQKYWHCKLCDSIFRYKPLWKTHLEYAHSKKIKENIYDCSYCIKKFSNEQKFLMHVKTHYKKECPICGMKITPTNFKKHVDAHSSPPEVCHICGITYKNSTSLRSHIHYTHSTRTYMCKFCKKVYKKSYDLIMHEKKEHTGTKDHICDVCGKGFFTLYNLNKHNKMTHMKLRPFDCKYCKKKFSSKYALVTHERQHTNITPYTCEVCGEGFRQNVSLKAHKKSKHNIVQPDTCECKVCGKKFSGPFAIMSHMRLH